MYGTAEATMLQNFSFCSPDKFHPSVTVLVFCASEVQI